MDKSLFHKFSSVFHLFTLMLSVFPDDIGAELIAIVIGKLKEMASDLLKKADEKILETETKVDDTYLKPVVQKIRDEFNIPG